MAMFVESQSALFVALGFALAAIALSAWNIYLHLRHYTKPQLQKYIVRICFVVPLYAVCSWLSLRFDAISPYVSGIRDCYEAFVIYAFLTLMLAYAGGDSTCVQQIEQLPPLKQPFPCCCLPRLLMNSRFLRWCKQGVIQFVVVKPIMAAISIVLLATGHFEDTAWTSFQLVVYNISYSLALWALLLFYLSTKSFLRPFHPVWKFFAVKMVIFLTYWQSLAVGFMPGITVEDASRWNNFILCLEMSFFAVIHCIAFSHSEFWSPSSQPSSVLTNVQEVLSVRDVIQDAKHSFMPAYTSYVLQSGTDPGSNAEVSALSHRHSSRRIAKERGMENKTSEELQGLASDLSAADLSPMMNSVGSASARAISPYKSDSNDSGGGRGSGRGSMFSKKRKSKGYGKLGDVLDSDDEEKEMHSSSEEVTIELSSLHAEGSMRRPGGSDSDVDD